jgi:hypothetical protein
VDADTAMLTMFGPFAAPAGHVTFSIDAPLNSGTRSVETTAFVAFHPVWELVRTCVRPLFDQQAQRRSGRDIVIEPRDIVTSRTHGLAAIYIRARRGAGERKARVEASLLDR